RWSWIGPDGTVVGIDEGRLELVEGITRHQAGNYTVSVTTSRGIASAITLVNVQYGPEKMVSVDRVDVSEGGKTWMECSAQGNPTPTITWARRDNTNGSSVLASGSGTARLVVDAAQRTDT
ncbi:unnamed protein product, partial [Meganyctiphanes norvegica]